RARTRAGFARSAPVTAWDGGREVGTAGSLTATTRRSTTCGARAGPASRTAVAQPDLTRNPTAAWVVTSVTATAAPARSAPGALRGSRDRPRRRPDTGTDRRRVT